VCLSQDARINRDNELVKNCLKKYDDELEKYIPVLMAQARIYWDRENYPMVEKLFFQSSEFCSEHEVWKLNVAHVFFMQETKFKDAIRYLSLLPLPFTSLSLIPDQVL
jgi:tetratricopeptide repeat protein 30